MTQSKTANCDSLKKMFVHRIANLIFQKVPDMLKYFFFLKSRSSDDSKTFYIFWHLFSLAALQLLLFKQKL